MNGIYGISEIIRITPFQGLDRQVDLFRRAVPYAIDLRAFSPMVRTFMVFNS